MSNMDYHFKKYATMMLIMPRMTARTMRARHVLTHSLYEYPSIRGSLKFRNMGPFEVNYVPSAVILQAVRKGEKAGEFKFLGYP
jgi:hypothetical protein